MTIAIKKLPEILETYFVDEARSIPTGHFGCVECGIQYIGPHIKRQAGTGTMAGWALTVECPGNNNIASFVALQYMRDIATMGRWIMVITPPSDAQPVEAAIWTYLHCAMGWEVGFIGAVVAGYVQDRDEIEQKLKGEFSVFAYGGSPVSATTGLEGRIGFPVIINGITINTGDLIIGDNDGVITIPRDEVEGAIDKCRENIVKEVNLLQHVREGMGAVDVLGLRDALKGKVDIEE